VAKKKRQDDCPDHRGVASSARCAACGRGMCEECFRFRIDGRAACARCAYETSTRPQRRVSLAVAFVVVAWAMAVWIVRRFELWHESPLSVIGAAVVPPIVAWYIAKSAKESRVPRVENRDVDEPVVEEVVEGGSPYRARIRRVVLAASPKLSGKATAIVVASSFAIAAAILPASMKVARWIEMELVLFVWWSIVAATLTVLLYRGFRIRDDYVFFLPWSTPPGEKGKKRSLGGIELRDGCGDVGCGDGCSGIDGEGVIIVLVVGIVLVGALGAAWILVELALPLLFVVVYAVFMRAIARVANDRHGCEKDLAKSLGYGLLWATIYLLPLAVATWAFHAWKKGAP
jgi:multisubunit Na+/H+ antiporter MnhG subunit